MPKSVTTPVTEQRNDSNAESATTEENSSTDITTEDGTESSSEDSEGSQGNVEIDVNSPAFKAAVEELVNERLAGEKDKLTAATASTAAVEEKLSTTEAALELIKAEKLSAETARDEALKDVMQLNVAMKKNVSLELIQSLKGETEEELLKAIELVQGSSKQRVDRIFDGKDSGVTKLDLAGIAQKSAKAFLKR